VCTKNVQEALKNIDLVVYDMAGTTVEEGGLVYQTLRRVMVEDGMSVSQDAMHPWHGAKKEAVIEHFARQDGTPEQEIESRVHRVSDAFEKAISNAYFSSDSRVSVIDDGLMEYFGQLKAAGIKIGLDTGYPADIQEGLVKLLGFDKVVDTYISSYDVPEGRPYPYMIHRIMERCGVMNVARVAKMGDSVRDMEEGRNAGCGLVVGVLSGADSAEDLTAAGADMIVPRVTDLPAPELAQPMNWVAEEGLPKVHQSNI
jgi:phosphonatase-like hydrolase